jgi:hypothetical protein
MATVVIPRPTREAASRRISPVRVWAAIGAVLVTLELVVLGTWVTGPNFRRVPVGADQPPEWMRVSLTAMQLGGAVAAAGVIWYLLLRPLIFERRLTVNGALVIAGILAAPWDGLSAYGHHWVNWNSYFLNRGSPLSEVPGVDSAHGPGYGQVLPFFNVAAYVIALPLFGAFGAWVMRRAKQRFPRLKAVGLIGICVLAIMVVETALEMVLAPSGVYTLAGSQWPMFFADHYYRITAPQMVHIGLLFTVPAVLTYFVSDSGETVVERGAQSIAGTRRRALTRGAALVGAVHLAILLTYHLPMMIYGMHSSAYPDDVQQRSYFLGNMCGQHPVLAPGAVPCRAP